MASVGVIYAVRRLTSATALKVYALSLSLVGIVMFVSLSHVFQNFAAVGHGGLPSVTAFALAAVLQTKLIVQLALVVGGCVFISLIVDTVRSIAPSRGALA